MLPVIIKKIPVDFNLFLFGCVHVGTIFHTRKGWLQLVDHMRSKIDGLAVSHNGAVDHGDALDAIDFQDPRFDNTSEQGFILEQMEQVKKDRIAIKDQILVMLIGNHELKKRALGIITKHVAKDLGVQYGGQACKLTYKNRRGEYLFKHLATHGGKTFNSVADDPNRRRTNRLLGLKRHLRSFPADDAVLQSCAHSHWCDRLKPESDTYWGDDGKDSFQARTSADHTAEYIHPDLRWYVNCGSFLRWGIPDSEQPDPENPVFSYAQVRGYRPLPNGYQLAKIRGGVIQSVEPVWVE